MKYTGNYNLKKPEGNDVVNIEDLNENADIIDQALKAHDDGLDAHMSDGTQHAKTVRFVIGTSTAGWTEKDCNYLCDGANDQVEIQQALDALPENGGEIRLLDGTYNIAASINISKDNVFIRGNGNATALKRMWDSSSGEGVITLTSVKGCRVENLQIDGNKTTYTANYNYGIYLYSSSNNTITGNTCNNNYYGIGLYSSSNNMVTGNTCNNNNHGIYLSSSSNNVVTGNTCNNGSSDGILLYSSTNNIVTGNTCNNNDMYGIRLSTSSNNTIISNTCIRGIGTPGDYTTEQYTIFLSDTDNNYNLITSNNCMGKAVVISGGTGNTVFNNKWDASGVTIDISDIPGLVGSRLSLGLNASATGNYSIALGRDASAGNHSVALGREASAGDYSVALGNDTSAVYSSVALGRYASAAENSSVALGYGASAENANEGILGGTGSLSTSTWKVPGDFTVNGTKNFEIPHPKPEKKATHVIRHGAVESPTPGDTLYRWRVRANKDNDLITIDLPDYFIYLNKDVQIWVTGQGHFGNGYGTLNRETERLEIHCQYEGEYNVLVIGTRNDDHESVRDWYIKGVEREIGESWRGETYVFSVDEIIEIEEIKEVS